MKAGFRFVPEEEAERRAAICAACPLNVQVQGCMGCSGVSALVKMIRRDRRTGVDGNACGCELKVKVLVPSEVVDNRGVDYPAWCWQNPQP